MSFLTLRNSKWTGGDVTISDDGRFVVIEIRDAAPVRGYMIVEVATGLVTKGPWQSLFEAQTATGSLRTTNQPKKEGAHG
jgi:hypothetical protein